MLQSIQWCRAVAAMLVVLFHSAGNLAKEKYFGSAAEPLERLFWFGGNAGVAFFFVLSGFIIHRTHWKDFDHPERLLSYLRKRVVRIYPTYLIIFLGICVITTLVPWLGGGLPDDAWVFVKSLLLLPQDKEVVGGSGAPVLVVAWTLQYELVFYAAFAAALVSRWVFLAVPASFLSSHLVLLFGMGMLASMSSISRYRPRFPGRVAVLAAIAFIATGMVANLSASDYLKPTFDLIYGLTAAVLVFALTRHEEGGKVAEDFLSRLGNSSYALYLMHFPLVAVFSKVAMRLLPTSRPGAVVALAMIVPCCVVIAEVFHRVVERPVLRFLHASSQTR
jgi:peptidoglycan/LPS O-acetylase OafA/YrhL